MLQESAIEDDDIDLSSVELSHYRLSKIRQQDLKLEENSTEQGLEPADGVGSAKGKDKEAVFLSQILYRLNECFIRDALSDNDLLNYAYTVRDKLRENDNVIQQMENNSAEQAMLGDFSNAMDEAILDSSDAHQNQMMQLLSDPQRLALFSRVVFDLLQDKT
jgi:type I restriction enzyme R subunit